MASFWGWSAGFSLFFQPKGCTPTPVFSVDNALGRIFRLTRERIRQIEESAMEKLKKSYRRERLQGFLEALLPNEAPDTAQ
jgi:hypothetical protein